MGLYDTVHLEKPLSVPGWDETVDSIQTKGFGNSMQDYVVGSVLHESPVLIGIVEETIWCAPKNEGEDGKTHPVYFAIWHRILAGVYLDPSEAEARLTTVDRLDLIAWLDQAQRTSWRWRRRYYKLFADVRELQERQQERETEGEEKKLRRFLRRLPDEVMRAPDPLAAILESHREKEEKPGDEGGLFW